MDQERTYKWIQDRLRDLHSGTLSEVDRIRLLELSKDDPFLKDALEGYQSAPGHDHIARLQTISHRIQTKHIARRRKLFPSRSQWVIQAVAASLLLLLVTWAVIYYVGKENNTVLVSAEKNKSILNDSVVDITSAQEKDDADMAYEEQSSSELSQEEPGLRANAQSKYEAAKKEIAIDQPATSTSPTAAQTGTLHTTQDIAIQEPNQASPQHSMTEESEADKPPTVNDAVTNERVRDEGAYANAMPQSMVDQRVTGQIINNYGQPVTGALVAIPNSNLITTSDSYGRFEMFIPGSQSPMEISSSGYQDTIMNVKRGQENIVVVLSASVEPYPAGVVYQQTTAKKAKPTAVYNNTSLSFLEYIKSNSAYPIQSQYSPTGHPVTLKFSVSSSGHPENVTTVKSSVPKKFHTEAIRLVENGPLWMCDKFPCEKEYTIYFE